MNHDIITTLAGGGAGYSLLQSTKWELVGLQPGETIKVAVALLLMLAGYLMYKDQGKEPPLSIK